jgi:hypothetical protein
MMKLECADISAADHTNDVALNVPVEACVSSPDTAITSRVVVTRKRVRGSHELVFTADHLEKVESLQRQVNNIRAVDDLEKVESLERLEKLESLERQVNDIRAEVFMEVDRFDRCLDKYQRQVRDANATLDDCKNRTQKLEYSLAFVQPANAGTYDMEIAALELPTPVQSGGQCKLAKDIITIRTEVADLRLEAASQWQDVRAEVKELRQWQFDLELRLAKVERDLFGDDSTSQSDRSV